MTDPIADMLTRIRNGLKARQETVALPYSKIKAGILELLASEGYIRSYETVGEGVHRQLVVALKYLGRRQPVISGLKRISRPGCRIYRGFSDLAALAGGLGQTIVSTSQGIMTHRQAEQAKVGGEVLCHIW